MQFKIHRFARAPHNDSEADYIYLGKKVQAVVETQHTGPPKTKKKLVSHQKKLGTGVLWGWSLSYMKKN